MPPPFLF